MLDAFGAMTKVAIVAGVGYSCALFPRANPYLSPEALKYISKLSNDVFLPALIITSIGLGLSVELLSRMGILVLFSIFTSIFSYFLAATVGKLIDGNLSNLYVAIYVAIASPNIISLPLMILQTLCGQNILNSDYNGDSSKCFADASSMVFIYSIGWHIVFWSYGFPLLQSLDAVQIQSDNRIIQTPSLISLIISGNISFQNLLERSVSNRAAIHKWIEEVVLSRLMISIYIGIFIGLIKPLQDLMFNEMSPLKPFGDAMITLGIYVLIVYICH
jgi:predicted permease